MKTKSGCSSPAHRESNRELQSRPEHIYCATPTPVVIDCIEFSSDLRRLDVLDELSFLAMECSFLGAASIGSRIIDRYATDCRDHPPSELLSFYASYRACVRAKVHALRAAQLSASADLLNGPQPFSRSHASQATLATANRYLHLANCYAAAIGRPLLLAVRGLSGVGKSTLAAALAESLGIQLIQSDAIRRATYGPAPTPTSYGGADYSADRRAAVYASMFQQAGALLAKGASVVLDGAFLTTELRAQAATLAARHDALFHIIHCQCPFDVAAERIRARRESAETLSEARPEFVQLQAAEEEPDPPDADVCNIDTTDSVPAMLQKVFSHIRVVDRGHTARSVPC